MIFFKRLLNGSSLKKENTPGSIKNPDAPEQLKDMVEPLLRNTTVLNVQTASKAPEASEIKSHFGGQPYFEEGAQWPHSANGNPMDFIFQIVNNGTIELPESIKLVQLFYDFEESAWETDDDGWHVKIYKSLNIDKKIAIVNPTQSTVKYCDILFEPAQSLPDWEGIDLFGDDIVQACEGINDDEPWEPYDEILQKLTGTNNYQSQLGGYPNWVQGESTPVNNKGENVKLLFQIDSEDNAGIMWGDVGVIYVFYDEGEDRVWFELQCH